MPTLNRSFTVLSYTQFTRQLTSLTPSFFIKVPVPSQESEWPCICVLVAVYLCVSGSVFVCQWPCICVLVAVYLCVSGRVFVC